MNFYSAVVFLHVLSAIFGLGPLAFLGFAPGGPTRWLTLERIHRLLKWVGLSLGVLFVTGAILIGLTRGALGEAVWMRVSFALFLLLGVLHGLTRRHVRRAVRTPEAAAPSAALRRLFQAMAGVTGAITYLMEAKPW